MLSLSHVHNYVIWLPLLMKVKNLVKLAVTRWRSKHARGHIRRKKYAPGRKCARRPERRSRRLNQLAEGNIGGLTGF